MSEAKLRLCRAKDQKDASHKVAQIRRILGAGKFEYDITAERSKEGTYYLAAVDREGIGLQNLAEVVIRDLFDCRLLTRGANEKSITLVESASRLDAARKFKIISKKIKTAFFFDRKFIFKKANGLCQFKLAVYDDISDLDYANELIANLFSEFNSLVMAENPNRMCIATGITKERAELIVKALNERAGHGYAVKADYNKHIIRFNVTHAKCRKDQELYEVIIEGDFAESYPRFATDVVRFLFENFDELFWQDRYCTPTELAQRANLTKRAINQRINAGKIRAHKLGDGNTYTYLIPEREALRVVSDRKRAKK